MNKTEKIVLNLKAQIDKNGGVIPANWINFIDLIEMLLKMILPLVSGKIYLIVSEILEMIEAASNS